MDDLAAVARSLVAPGKGILAADESLATIERRLAAVGIPSTVDTRRAYREVLLGAPGLGEYISGVILFDETIRQAAADGTPFLDLLHRQGILPGIKVDTGAHPLAGFPGEKVTEGLDGLRDRLREYRRLGARFTKWRAVIAVGPGLPTRPCLKANAHALARFACLSQEEGLVPIVEPEVLMDGDHTIDRCEEATRETLEAVFHELHLFRVDLEASLLKPSMVLPGRECPRQASVAEVAERTVRALRATVPAAVPGVVFLSGGQTEEAATAHLNAINRLPPQPWQLSFSYGRALQASALAAWAGKEENVDAARSALLRRARLTALARSGAYEPELELAA